MMNFRDKNQALPTTLLGLALVIATGAVLYMALVPVPTTQSVKSDEQKHSNDDRRNTGKAQRDLHDELTVISDNAFNGQEQDADSAILDLVTKLTAKRNVKLVGFRPQRTVDAGQLTQLPYIVSVSGSFPNIIAFTGDLEAKGTKLAVNTVQMAASDTSTDNVTGNISVVGYLNTPFANGAQNG